MMNIYIAPRGFDPQSGNNGSASVYALLGHTFRACYGGDLPEIKKTSNGKPFFPERPEIFFSLSHSKTHVACALSPCPVGVDIESPRGISERAVRYFCSDEELALFDPLDLWVLKESYIKLIGGTLASVKHLRFSRLGGRIVTADENVFSRLYAVDGCRAAASCLGGNPPESVELIMRSSDFTTPVGDCGRPQAAPTMRNL